MRRQTTERRERILRNADAVFLAQGYAGASMEAIARGAGGSKQTLYNYFPSKEALFAEVIHERAVHQADPLFARIFEGPDLRTALARFCRELIAFIGSEDILAFRRIIVAEGGRRSELGGLYYINGPRRGWLQVAEFFKTAMNEGQLRRADPWVAAMHFQGLCEAGHYHRLLDGSILELSESQIAEAAEAAVDVFLRAYAGDKAQTAAPPKAEAGQLVS